MTDSLEQKILSTLPTDGSARGNISLINELQCTPEDYKNARQHLLLEGAIIPGRGQGGTIRLSGVKQIDCISQAMLDAIKKEVPDGQSIGNKKLRILLKLDESQYWEARDILVQNGDIAIGGGKGGSVYLTFKESLTNKYEIINRDLFKFPTKESSLMFPLKQTLDREWAKYKRYGENYKILDTSRQGRNATGAWSRPDLLACVCKEYKFNSKYIEMTSFEVKAHDGIDEKCVYEALSHKKSAHFSFLLLHDPPQKNTIKQSVWDSIYIDAQKYGIGIIYFSDPYDFDSWEISLDAARNSPDPDAVESFFERQAIDDATKQAIQNWISL